ncbi:fluoride efflux transporter CrcB [Cytobacillus gottheilii]|uniref:fluoride efflux transporter CrcB n=1 Tax=Cytobacillus gottheilii TaxID=859144 RepID=UPI0009BA30BA|nr:fluoride efflux transporter CrcB [Cytobacillus gottheilii]
MKYLYVGMGGMIGSSLRYGLSFMPYSTVHSFPFATFFTNILGSLLLGVLVANSKRFRIKAEYQLFFGTGIIGSFTTLSAVSAETARLLVEGNYLIGFIYVLSSIISGFLGAALGLKIRFKQKEES